MEKAKRIFGLKKEAILLDSWLYILKSMLAIGTGYILGNMFSVTRLDMISVLLGVMYNLEATNISAVKGGINQLLASFLGALTTGVLVYFLGVNVFTVMLGMGLTLFIALKIDYTAVSPVAIFTSIYMTQFLQSDSMGNPSILLTIRLRIFALGLGVLVAMVFNLIFSLIYYRKITRKRLEYVKLKLDDVMGYTYRYLMGEETVATTYNTIFSMAFADIETVSSNLEALSKDPLLPLKILEKEHLDSAKDIVKRMKLMTHLAYDSCYIKDTYKVSFIEKQLKSYHDFINKFIQLDFMNTVPEDNFMPHYPLNTVADEETERIYENLNLMFSEYNTILEIHQKMK
jgi:hypothetical protein